MCKGVVCVEFSLKKWSLDFVPSIARYANNKMISNNLRDGFPYPYSEDDAKNFITDCIDKGDENQLFYAIVVDGQAVGSISVLVQDDVFRKSAELGYFIGVPFWGKGIMTRAVTQICDEAFKTFDIVRIFAEVYEYNAGSRRVLEKAGFNLEGIDEKSISRNGEIYNSFIYTIIKVE